MKEEFINKVDPKKNTFAAINELLRGKNIKLIANKLRRRRIVMELPTFMVEVEDPLANS